MFIYSTTPVDLQTAVDEVADAIISLGTPTPWEIVYNNPNSSSFSLSTLSGPESTDNHFKVVKSKLSHNTAGTGVSEYTYVLIEADDVAGELIVRLCRSFTAGGTNTGVTPLADALRITNITGIMAAFAFGDFDCLTLGIDNSSTAEAVTIAPIEHVLGFPHVSQNDFVCMLKNYGVIEGTVQNVQGKFDLETIAEAGDDSIQLLGKAMSPIILRKVSDPDYMPGAVRGVYFGASSSVQDFDIIDPINTTKLFRCLTNVSGFLAAEDT